MYVKNLIQDVWRSKLGWDEEISEDQMNKWIQWVNVLSRFEQLKKSFEIYHGLDIYLHTLADASRDGYSAVCYLRLFKDNSVVCLLIGSKTRVARIKITSVPFVKIRKSPFPGELFGRIPRQLLVGLTPTIENTVSFRSSRFINTDSLSLEGMALSIRRFIVCGPLQPPKGIILY